MSSVGSSDSSNRQDDTVRRTREEAKANEAELARKHRKEIRRVSEQHAQEIEKLKAQHAESIKALKEASSGTITKRDHKYQQDMDKMRELHTKQLQQNADETQRREEALREAMGGDNGREKIRNDERIQKLSGEYKENLQEKDRAMTEALKMARDGQQSGISENRKKLEKAHKMEIEAIKAERNETVGHLQKTLTDTRETSDDRLREMQIQKLRQTQTASENLMDAVRNERDARVDSEGLLRQGFESGIQNTKDRYEKAMKKEREANQVSTRQLKTTTANRLDNQLRRLERENSELKDANVRDRVKLKQEKELEVDHLRDAWGKNIDRYQEDREAIVRSSNEKGARDIAEVRSDLEKQITSTNRFYRGKMEENNHIARSAYDNLVGDFEGRTAQTQMTADNRIKNVYANASEEKSRLIGMHQEGHEIMQREHQADIKALRLTLEQEKTDTVNRMQEQLRKQELQHSDKMNSVVQKYEKQVQGLQDQVLSERKRGEEKLKRTVEELQRSHKVTVDQMELKSRERMRQVSAQQAEELRSVNKRNEEKIDAVLTEIKKT